MEMITLADVAVPFSSPAEWFLLAGVGVAGLGVVLAVAFGIKVLLSRPKSDKGQ